MSLEQTSLPNSLITTINRLICLTNNSPFAKQVFTFMQNPLPGFWMIETSSSKRLKEIGNSDAVIRFIGTDEHSAVYFGENINGALISWENATFIQLLPHNYDCQDWDVIVDSNYAWAKQACLKHGLDKK